MAGPKVLVQTGYGINCDDETAFAFREAAKNLGMQAEVEIVHINDIIENLRRLQDYQIIAWAGGFSFGDDTGSGKGMSNRTKNHLSDAVRETIENGTLGIGICNGFQIMVKLGIVPALNGQYGDQQADLTYNDNARYLDRWVDIEFQGKSPWVQNVGQVSFPIAHAEGKFYAEPAVLARLNEKGLVSGRYVKGEICEYQGMKPNPNGSLEGIASITDETGRFIGMMPHPERAIVFTQLPQFPIEKERCKRAKKQVPTRGPGMIIFENGLAYFK